MVDPQPPCLWNLRIFPYIAKAVITLKIFRGGAFPVLGGMDPTCDHRYPHRHMRRGEAEEVLRQMHRGEGEDGAKRDAAQAKDCR